MDYLHPFLIALFGYLAEAAPYLVIGYLLIALVREFVPADVLAGHLGGSGVRPVLNALGMGSLLPICSCGAIPLGIGLVRSGAAQGTTLALMASSAAISPVSVILALTLLGPSLLAAYATTVVVGVLLLGLIGNRWLPGQVANMEVAKAVCHAAARGDEGHCDDGSCCPDTSGHVALPTRARRAMRWAYWDLGADVSFDLLVGLSVAAAITAFLPPEWIIASLGQPNVLAILAIILVAIPLYTCSAPSIVVMKSLLLLGASPGAAVAFLVAGPATNLGEINAIRGSMSGRAAVHYLASLMIIALAGGMITNQVMHVGTGPLAEESAALALDQILAATTWSEAVAHVPAWHWPFIVPLAGVLLLGIVRRLQRLFLTSAT